MVDGAAAEPVGPALDHDGPPAGLAAWRRRRASRHQDRTDDIDATDTALPIPVQEPEQDEGPPTGYYLPDFDDDFDDEAGEGFGGEDGFTDRPFRSGRLDGEPFDEEDAAEPEYEDEDGMYSGEGLAGDEDFDGYSVYPDGFDEYEDFDDPDAEETEEADVEDSEDAPSPAREWLVLAGQLALGVIGGAGVWLGFNWLWGKLPAAALVAALIVTTGLVWIVRKVRRAEDLQTTVLALLIGLIATVSPAALLLVSR